MKTEKIYKIGITSGDPNGIGPEVIYKSLFDVRMKEIITPVIYGKKEIFNSFYNKNEEDNFKLNIIKDASYIAPKKINLINTWNGEFKVEFGKLTEEAGKFAVSSIEQATKDLESGKIDAIVTAPINKKNINNPNFNFKGHTDYLVNKFNAKEYLMLMVSEQIKITSLTDHIALKDVPASIKSQKIVEKISLINKTLISDYKINSPRIAILGLNPHASDDGLMGDEEKREILPALNICKNQNILAFGPYSPDGFFGALLFKKFDGVLAMYHDQMLIPFKLMSFENGVNVTAGLPIVRTSPAHGTAMDIAGKNMVNKSSMCEAIFMAKKILLNRETKD